jgi:hypothetical protein
VLYKSSQFFLGVVKHTFLVLSTLEPNAKFVPILGFLGADVFKLSGDTTVMHYYFPINK